MKILFSKYHGTGNDFILVDNRTSYLKTYKELVKFLCDRRFGIGADGLILLQNHPDMDFEMIYFNSDGNESSMCGNGGRCITAFAKRLGIIQNNAAFNAIDGPHQAIIVNENEDKNAPVMNVKLRMKDVSGIEIGDDYIYMDTGSPHYVVKVDDATSVDIVNDARKIRYNERFKTVGTNVNFIQNKIDHLYVRTYERGVEDETLSCGTGVTASAIAASIWDLNKYENNCSVNTPGGKLSVHFEKEGDNFKNVWLEGPTAFVFEGIIEI